MKRPPIVNPDTLEIINELAATMAEEVIGELVADTPRLVERLSDKIPGWDALSDEDQEALADALGDAIRI